MTSALVVHEPPAGPRRPTLRSATLASWAIGTLLVLGLAALRLRRFLRLVETAEPAGEALVRRGSELAAELGLDRCPELRILDRRLPPLVWSCGGSPIVLLPQALVDRLAPKSLDAILLHELAHVRRHDWVRLPELLACALFWWHGGRGARCAARRRPAATCGC